MAKLEKIPGAFPKGKQPANPRSPKVSLGRSKKKMSGLEAPPPITAPYDMHGLKGGKKKHGMADDDEESHEYKGKTPPKKLRKKAKK